MNEGDLQLQNISRTLNECDLQLEQQKIVKTSNEELTESETKLIKDAIMSDQKLVDLVIEYRATVDRICDNVEKANTTVEEIKEIIKDIYHKLFPNRTKYIGVVTVVRDIFYEEILGWKLKDGKHDPEIWEVFPATGERIGPTKLKPAYVKIGKQITGLMNSVQRGLNDQRRSKTTNSQLVGSK
jgi:hypothetical protein